MVPHNIVCSGSSSFFDRRALPTTRTYARVYRFYPQADFQQLQLYSLIITAITTTIPRPDNTSKIDQPENCGHESLSSLVSHNTIILLLINNIVARFVGTRRQRYCGWRNFQRRASQGKKIWPKKATLYPYTWSSINNEAMSSAKSEESPSGRNLRAEKPSVYSYLRDFKYIHVLTGCLC